MKKWKTSILFFILIAMVLAILAVKLKDPVSTLLGTPIPTPATTSEVQSNNHERNMYLMEDFGIACGFKYTVKDVYLTHKRGEWGCYEWEEDSADGWNELYQRRLQTDKIFFNENGDFIGDYFYMIITMEIQNLSDQMQMISTLQNSIIPFIGHTVGTGDDMAGDCRDSQPFPIENSSFEKYKDQFFNSDAPFEPNPDYYLWFLEPGDVITVQMVYFPLSSEILKKVLNGEWTLSICPAPMGALGRAYSGPGKLGQEEQIDPEILKEKNFTLIDGVRSTYIELPITEDCVRD